MTTNYERGWAAGAGAEREAAKAEIRRLENNADQIASTMTLHRDQRGAARVKARNYHSVLKALAALPVPAATSPAPEAKTAESEGRVCLIHPHAHGIPNPTRGGGLICEVCWRSPMTL